MVTSPRIGVLAIQGDVREHLHALRLVDVDGVVVRSADQLDDLDGLIIPGGESTTMSILAVREGFLEPLRRFRESGRACFGSCAGLIFLADRVVGGRPDQQTIGGLAVTAERNAFGRQVNSFESPISIDVIGGPPFDAVFIRAPAITAVDPGVEVLARVAVSTGDKIVAVRQGSLLATAFHPELTDDPRLHRYFVGMAARWT